MIPKNIAWVLLNALLLLFFMSLLRFVFWIAFKNPYPENEAGALLLGLRYDVRVIAIPTLFIWLLSSLPFLNPFLHRAAYRFWNGIYLLLVFVLLTFYAADFAHYAYLHQRLNASVLGYMQDTLISTEMIWQTYPVIRGLLVIAVFLLAVYWIFRFNYRYTQRYSGAPTTNRVSSILFFSLLGFFIYGRIGSKPLQWKDAFTIGNDYSANLSLNPFQSFGATLIFKNPDYEIEKVKAHYLQMATYFGVENPDPKTLRFSRNIAAKRSLSSTPTNVVLVVCESFSAYKSSMWGNPLNTTPFFDSLCRKGVFFDRCVSPSYGTARGVWAILTGVPDVSLVNTNSRRPELSSQHTIVNDFKNYDKYYFVGGTADWANLRSLFQNSIDDLHIYEQNDYHQPKADVWGVSDKNVFLGANNILRKQQKPFFAIIQTADNHRPYTIPSEDRTAFTSKTVPLAVLQKYGFENVDEYNAFRYTDFCFRQFLNAAQTEKYFKNTLFVFVGDHGIRGNAGNMLPAIWTQQGLTTFHVPLLFYQPALLSSKRLSWPVSQMDVLPTAAGICGVGYTNTTMGMDLLDSTRTSFFKRGKKWAPVFDDLKQQAGILQGNVFYEKPLTGQMGQLYSSIDNSTPANKTDMQIRSLDSITDAWLQWSRYLPAHNQKLKN